MPTRTEPSVRVLWPSWASPARVVLAGLTLALVDTALAPRFSFAGLDAPWGLLGDTGFLLGLAYVVLPAGVLSLFCVARAMRARTTTGAVLGCFVAGLVFAVSNVVGAGLWLDRVAPPGTVFPPSPPWATAAILLCHLLAYSFGALSLVLPNARAKSCEAVHGALVVTGVWLLAGTVLHWTGVGRSFSITLETDPADWSVLRVFAGLAMVATGIAADVRLVAWLQRVRRGDHQTWRIQPRDARVVADVPPLVPDRRVEAGFVLVEMRGEEAAPVAFVFEDASEGVRLLLARAVATIAALLLLACVVLTFVPLVLLRP